MQQMIGIVQKAKGLEELFEQLWEKYRQFHYGFNPGTIIEENTMEMEEE